MYLEQKNYNKETVKEVQKEQRDKVYPIINGGYPTFNTCNHTTLDMSHLTANTDDYQHTLSIKLDDDRYVTVCVMKVNDEVKEICLDIMFHGEGKTRALSFKEGTSKSIDEVGLLAVINDIRGV